MTPMEHYQAAEQNLAAYFKMKQDDITEPGRHDYSEILAVAQVHASLASAPGPSDG